ncbi:glycosyltransferase family 4 protein [Haloarchaeobius amylolyticus]|uniref:Glycosyltransferase family 4 protein n=1 Tax=Haloarchaeobius amylolyticus TaxID=1198296 RepID=A0ABD6BJ66_9EURY
MKIGIYHDNVGTRHAGGIAIYARKMAIELAKSNKVHVYTQGGDVVSTLVESDANIVETPTFDLPSFSGRLSSLVGNPLPFGRQDVSKLGMIGWSAHNGVIDHIDDHVDVLITFQTIDDLLLSNLVDVPTIRGFLSDRSAGIASGLREQYSQTETNFANTPYLAEQVADRFDTEVHGVIPTGVDTETFRPTAEPAFQHDDPTVLFVGRLVESKGIFDLLEAVARLEERVHLRIVGTGSEAEAVDRRSAELGIADRVALEGEVPHTDLPGYYAAADIFCLPTHVDSFATVNLEAMACGAPVVTTDLEGIKTYLTPDENGVVVPPGDRNRLADALAELLSDPSRRRMLGVQARRRACEFTWSQQATQLEEFCATVLGVDRTKEAPLVAA